MYGRKNRLHFQYMFKVLDLLTLYLEVPLQYWATLHAAKASYSNVAVLLISIILLLELINGGTQNNTLQSLSLLFFWHFFLLPSTGCNAVLTLESGSVQTNIDGGVIIHHFRCKQDYVMVGKDRISCRGGVWDGSRPRCYKGQWIRYRPRPYNHHHHHHHHHHHDSDHCHLNHHHRHHLKGP